MKITSGPSSPAFSCPGVIAGALALLVCWPISAHTAPIVNDAPRPAITVPKAVLKPLLTAAVDDPAWPPAVTLPALTPSLGAPPPSIPVPETEVQLLWDADYLYVRFICRDTEIYTPVHGHDAPIYQGDAAEIFLDPVGDSRQWVELEFNADNDTFELLYLCTTEPKSDSALCLTPEVISRDSWTISPWDLKGLRSQAARLTPAANAQDWIVDIAIPAKELLRRAGLKQFAPMTLRGDFLRYKYMPSEPGNTAQVASLELESGGLRSAPSFSRGLRLHSSRRDHPARRRQCRGRAARRQTLKTKIRNMKTPRKHQSLGNWIASASFKPSFTSGQSEGAIPAFGYFRVGDVMEFESVRLWAAREGVMEHEIAGSATASSWEPYEVVAESEKLRVRRSTTWENRHIQWWEIRGGESSPEVIIWFEFQLMAPTQITIEGAVIWWETLDGNTVAVKALGGDVLGAAAGEDAQQVRQQLEQGRQGSEWDANYTLTGTERKKGFAGIRLRGGRQGQLLMATGRGRVEAREKLERTQAHPEAVVDEMRQFWSEFYSTVVPACPSSDDGMQKIWKEAWYVLRSNQIDYGVAPVTKPFGSPSKFNYTHQWLWDSCFQAVVWSRSNTPARGQDEVANLLENPQENGRISHEIMYSAWMNWGAGLRGNNFFAPTSQPPVLAMAVEKVYERTGDLAWVARAWAPLKGGLNWWGTVRDPDQDGLAGWISGWESGLDDSPRWDHVPRDPFTFFPDVVDATELNALLVNEWRTMARLARLLGRAEEAQACEQKSRQILAVMREKLWDANEGFFFCLDHEKKAHPHENDRGASGSSGLGERRSGGEGAGRSLDRREDLLDQLSRALHRD